MAAIAQQPVAVGVDASCDAFQYYDQGIFKLRSSCGTDLDHAVTAVGYGNEGGLMYHLVKNSWGPKWGVDGYIKFEQAYEGEGNCGILMDCLYPTTD